MWGALRETHGGPGGVRGQSREGGVMWAAGHRRDMETQVPR